MREMREMRENSLGVGNSIAAALLLFAVLGHYAYAAEVDHYSRYNAPLNDSREQLNQMVAEHLAQVLDDGELIGCDEGLLYQKLRTQFNNKYHGKLAQRIIKGKQLDQVSIHPKQSIYREFFFLKKFPFWIAKKKSLNPVAAVIRVGDVRLGTDKLEHVWREGFDYFKSHYLQGQYLQFALFAGYRGENGRLGTSILASGIFSYADLAANFQGMRFWNHLLQRGDDALGENTGPYIECRGNRWVQVKEIDMGDYIDHGLDESINCSLFRSKRVLGKMRRALGKLSEQHGEDYRCPMRGKQVREGPLLDRYGDLAWHLLNFRGHDTVKGHSAFLLQRGYSALNSLR